MPRRNIRADTVARFVERHRIRRLDGAGALEHLRAPIILVPPALRGKAVARQLARVNRQMSETEKAAQLLDQVSPDSKISEPGQNR